MDDSLALIADLRRIAAGRERARQVTSLDDWMSSGLPSGQVHELFATTEDSASAAGFAAMVAIMGAAIPLLWLRTEAAERRTGRLHAAGLLELGLAPHQLLLAVVPDEAALLRAAADATRCAGLGAVLIEAWGKAPALDLTASRRLMLAAEQSGVTVLVLRAQAEPTPSATATRWRVETMPSTALDANAPGAPAFSVELLRCRGAPAGIRWQVEWNRDDRCFRPAPLPGVGIPVAIHRAAARDAAAPVRRTA